MRALRVAPIRLIATERHVDQAIELAIRLQHSIYDCLYLALAFASRMPVVSADRRFVNAVRRHADLSRWVVLLAETAH